METDVQIAQQLKALRSQRGWTIDRLAAASGVSRAMISKVERAESSATAALLSKLSAALGVPLSDLLAPPAQAGVVSRKAERMRWQDPATGFVRELVTPRLTGSTVEVIEVELPAAARVDYQLDTTPAHAQHVIALTEGLRVTQAPPAQPLILELGAGDALFMNAAGAFAFENSSPLPCRYLVVIERPRTPS